MECDGVKDEEDNTRRNAKLTGMKEYSRLLCTYAADRLLVKVSLLPRMQRGDTNIDVSLALNAGTVV